MSESIELTIRPPGRFRTVDFPELWRYRDLFLVLAFREVSVRYKQTALGAVWAILQPLVQMVVFSFIFNKMAGVQSGDGTPYQIFLYVGLLLWQYYSGTLTRISESMVVNANMIQKIYFPRLVLPCASALSGFIDLGCASIVLAGLMIYYRFAPHWQGIALLPLLFVCMLFNALGVGLLFAAINVRYRDVRHALPFIVQTLMYATPVVYPVSLLKTHPILANLMLFLNPISGVISTARASLLGKSPIEWNVVLITCIMSVVFFVVGILYFRSSERHFADIV